MFIFLFIAIIKYDNESIRVTMYSMTNIRAGIVRALHMPRGIHRDNSAMIEMCIEIVNRNPRNLERLRIARKPDGYHLDVPGHSFWHKLYLTKKPRYISAEIHHFENGPVITVSSAEWALKKQLYRCTDGSAYMNVGRLLAQRCLESGIYEIEVDTALIGEKCELLIKQLEDNNITLTEPKVYKYPNSWDSYRPEKPWDIQE